MGREFRRSFAFAWLGQPALVADLNRLLFGRLVVSSVDELVADIANQVSRFDLLAAARTDAVVIRLEGWTSGPLSSHLADASRVVTPIEIRMLACQKGKLLSMIVGTPVRATEAHRLLAVRCAADQAGVVFGSHESLQGRSECEGTSSTRIGYIPACICRSAGVSVKFFPSTRSGFAARQGALGCETRGPLEFQG